MNKNETAELNRRDFIGSFATLMTMLGGVELITRAPVQAADLETLVPFQIKCGVIGLGNWGREIIATLSRLKTARIVAVCDTYPASLKRAANSAPAAKGVDDYRRILDDKETQAVIIATPTHQHRDIAVAALQAGKHAKRPWPIPSTTPKRSPWLPKPPAGRSFRAACKCARIRSAVFSWISSAPARRAKPSKPTRSGTRNKAGG